MKKKICIFAAILIFLTIALTISALTLAAAPEEIAPQATCSHSSYTSSYYYTYIYMNDNYHEVYRTEKRQCNNPSCRDVFYTGNPVPQPLEEHSWSSWLYVRSVHVGDPSTHYNVFERSCTACKGRDEMKESSHCKRGNCVDFYSLRGYQYTDK